MSIKMFKKTTVDQIVAPIAKAVRELNELVADNTAKMQANQNQVDKLLDTNKVINEDQARAYAVAEKLTAIIN